MRGTAADVSATGLALRSPIGVSVMLGHRSDVRSSGSGDVWAYQEITYQRATEMYENYALLSGLPRMDLDAIAALVFERSSGPLSMRFLLAHLIIRRIQSITPLDLLPVVSGTVARPN